jgi:hypothetical protein
MGNVFTVYTGEVSVVFISDTSLNLSFSVSSSIQ